MEEEERQNIVEATGSCLIAIFPSLGILLLSVIWFLVEIDFFK